MATKPVPLPDVRAMNARDFLRSFGGGFFRLAADGSLSVQVETQIFSCPGKWLGVDEDGVYVVSWNATPVELAQEATALALANAAG